MRELSRLAWRNLWRNRRRTLLTAAMIGFASAILVFFICLQFSSYETSINASISIFQGHAQVQRQGYQDQPQVRLAIEDPEELRSKIARVAGVTNVAQRGAAFALVSSKDRTYGSQIVGVEPRSERLISSIPGVVRKGRYLEGARYEAVIGEVLARNLKVTVGDELTLLGQGRDGSFAATVLPVVGIFVSGSVELDRALIQMPLAAFQEVFSMGTRAHSLVIRAAGLEKLEGVKEQVSALIAPESKLAFLTWDELTPGLKEAIELDMASGWLFYLSLVLIVSFSVLNTFLMSVLERTREFGILLSLGMRPARITQLVYLECVFLSLVGVLLGIIIGGAVVIYFGVYGFSIPGSEEIMKIWNLPAAIYPRLSFTGLTLGPGLVLGMSILAVTYPAFRVFRLRPLEALHAT